MKKSRLKLPPSEYKLLCNHVMTRDRWMCRHCRFRNGLNCHHIVFRSQGGDDASWNLITLCGQCHDAIHARNLIVLAPSGNILDPINADKPVKFHRMHGWRPK